MIKIYDQTWKIIKDNWNSHENWENHNCPKSGHVHPYALNSHWWSPWLPTLAQTYPDLVENRESSANFEYCGDSQVEFHWISDFFEAEWGYLINYEFVNCCNGNCDDVTDAPVETEAPGQCEDLECNTGECLASENTAYCRCSYPFSGVNCEINEIAIKPCAALACSHACYVDDNDEGHCACPKSLVVGEDGLTCEEISNGKFCKPTQMTPACTFESWQTENSCQFSCDPINFPEETLKIQNHFIATYRGAYE